MNRAGLLLLPTHCQMETLRQKGETAMSGRNARLPVQKRVSRSRCAGRCLLRISKALPPVELLLNNQDTNSAHYISSSGEKALRTAQVCSRLRLSPVPIRTL